MQPLSGAPQACTGVKQGLSPILPQWAVTRPQRPFAELQAGVLGVQCVPGKDGPMSPCSSSPQNAPCCKESFTEGPPQVPLCFLFLRFFLRKECTQACSLFSGTRMDSEGGVFWTTWGLSWPPSWDPQILMSQLQGEREDEAGRGNG